VLVAGPFSGGPINPACAFGSASIARTFRNQAVYWVGPLVGAAVADLLYDNALFPCQNSDSIKGVSDRIVRMCCSHPLVKTNLFSTLTWLWATTILVLLIKSNRTIGHSG